jgi:hypothetical protein
MQKFSGIYMGRRRKQTSETEAKMEGLGEYYCKYVDLHKIDLAKQ